MKVEVINKNKEGGLIKMINYLILEMPYQGRQLI